MYKQWKKEKSAWYNIESLKLGALDLFISAAIFLSSGFYQPCQAVQVQARKVNDFESRTKFKRGPTSTRILGKSKFIKCDDDERLTDDFLALNLLSIFSATDVRVFSPLSSCPDKCLKRAHRGQLQR